MYKDYNMTQLTLLKETSVHIPTHDMSQYANDIVETIHDTEFRPIVSQHYSIPI